MKHTLNVVPSIYSRLADGSKTFHVTEATPCFQKGDSVLFREFDPTPVSSTDKSTPKGLTGSPDIEYTIGFIEILEADLVVFSLLSKNLIEQKLPKKAPQSRSKK